MRLSHPCEVGAQTRAQQPARCGVGMRAFWWQVWRMEIHEHLASLDLAGRRLAASAAAAGPQALVPSCPGWRVADLLRHTGGVHRWAALVLGTGRDRAQATAPELVGRFFPEVADSAAVDWYREGHADLLAVLESTAPEQSCWTFLDAPSPLAFWARRQAHEATVHRLDAELALGEPTPVDPVLAADGIDELLTGFFARPGGRLVSDPPTSLGVRSTDLVAAWSIRIGPESRVPVRGETAADCLLEGSADDLYAVLWNRRDPGCLTIAGDQAVVALWRERATIVWG
jgi:uncharacterized protein (TIGR03083 family)